MWAPLPRTNVGERISQQIGILWTKKARSFHGEAGSFNSYMTWQPKEPLSCTLVNSAGSTWVVGACAPCISEPSMALYPVPNSEQQPPKQSPCYHATWEGFRLHVNVSNQQLCEGHNLHHRDCPRQEAPVWITSVSMCIISAETRWISVTLSLCSLGILIHSSVLAGTPYF